MKKMLLVTILFIVPFLVLLAPDSGAVLIFTRNPIQCITSPQEVLQAIIYIESGNGGAGVYNRNEPQAVGILQIWPIVVRDVNRIIGYEKYRPKDRLNNKKAKEMFWIYQKYYNPSLNPDKMARIWCGGPDGAEQDCTLSYLRLVKHRLYP